MGQRNLEDPFRPSFTVPTEIELPIAEERPELHYDHLSGMTSTRPVADILQEDGSRYCAALKSQLCKLQIDKFWGKRGMFFTDASSGISYQIVGIDYQTKNQGARSGAPRTLFFKHFDTNLHEFPPRADGDYEWMPCSELVSDPDTVWDTEKNAVYASTVELSYQSLKRTMDDDETGEFACYSALLDNLKDSRVGFNEDSLEAARVSVNDIPPPRKFADLATHPEGKDYLASIIREINSFDENGMTEVPDIDVKDIPPELILQLIPMLAERDV
jgi:hypothetical protein